MKIITDHKCGSSVSYILKEFLKKQNREVELCNFYLFNVSKYDPNEKYLLVVRNPREVIVSGMLYHRKCTLSREGWIYGGNYYGGWERFFTEEDKDKYKKYRDIA